MSIEIGPLVFSIKEAIGYTALVIGYISLIWFMYIVLDMRA